jgi:molybdopterin-guanine dinucleotide biosynthesis protein B
MLVAPDQLVLQTQNRGLSLTTLAHRYFPDVDIVIGEGFKTARKVAKIEVCREQGRRLHEEVNGIIAVATDLKTVTGAHVFSLDDAAGIARFIEKRFLVGREGNKTAALLVNGKKVPLKNFVQEALAGTVIGFVNTLKFGCDIKEIELRIRLGTREE